METKRGSLGVNLNSRGAKQAWNTTIQELQLVGHTCIPHVDSNAARAQTTPNDGGEGKPNGFTAPMRYDFSSKAQALQIQCLPLLEALLVPHGMSRTLQ